MEPDGSLSRSQEPSIGPYPEPDRSNPYHPILSLHTLLTYINQLIRRVRWDSAVGMPATSGSTLLSLDDGLVFVFVDWVRTGKANPSN
jgi:hypothetical protein